MRLHAFLAALVALVMSCAAPQRPTRPCAHTLGRIDAGVIRYGGGALNPRGRAGPAGAAGSTPSGTGIVSVTGGVLDSASTLRARVAADATNLRTDLGLGNLSRVGTLYLPLGSYSVVDATQGTVVVGGSAGSYDSTVYAISGLTQTWTVTVTAAVTSGDTGTLVLYDLTAAAAVTTINTITSTTPAAYTGSCALPGAAHLYELRLSCTGADATHYVAVRAVALKITWS